MRKPNGYWNNYDRCYEEAKKYKTRKEFRKGNNGAYQAAWKNNWLKDFTHFLNGNKIQADKKRYWTEERVFEEAKKYKTRNEFNKGNATAYNVAWKNGWLNNYTWLILTRKPNGYWNDYDRCYKEAKKYKTRSEFKKNNDRAYQIAINNKWIDKMDWLIDGRVKLFTDKIDCVYKYYFEETNSIYVGRTIQRKTRHINHIYRIDNDTVAKYARENGFAVPQMEIIEDNLTIEEGQKQEDFWINFYKEKGYNILNKKRGGSIGTIGIFKNNVSYIDCCKESKKYKTKTDFRNGNNIMYRTAIKMGWISKMDWLKNGRINNIYRSKKVLQYTKDEQFITEYPSISEAERQTGIKNVGIIGCCKGKYGYNSAGGFKWKYA